MTSLLALLENLRAHGCAPVVDGDDLRIRGAVDRLSAAELDELKSRKTELIAFLSGARTAPIRRIDRERGRLPLSFAQERLWFLEQLGTLGSSYNLPMELRLQGVLDADALQESLWALAQRHESLRTHFGTEEGRPVQFLDAATDFKLQQEDLSQLSAADRQAAVANLAQAGFDQPFDLRKGPLWRGTLVRLTEHEHVLLLVWHHIIIDGWSMEIFVQELAALYRSRTAGDVPPLSALEIQYGDFAAWQKDWLRADRLNRQLDYWKRQLKGVAPLVLPADRPRPAVMGTRGAMVSFDVPAHILEPLRALCRQEGVTLFMLLLAAYQVLLWRWSAQQDIAVGTPTAGRTHQQLENLVGFFVNTLVLRSRLHARSRFVELLQQVRQTALEAYANQDVPFVQLVAALQPERSLSSQPLFQTILTVQAGSAAQPSFGPQLACSTLELGSKTATQFDLTLYVVEKRDRLTCELEYRVELFDRATIERMAGHFGTLLADIGARPAARLHELKILTPQERRQLLVEWNDTAMELPPRRYSAAPTTVNPA